MIVEDRRYYAVRCCCKPTKVLGFLLLPTGPVQKRIVIDRYGERHEVSIKTMDQILDDGRRIGSEMAIYSEDRPLDFWMAIPGFVAAITPDYVEMLHERFEARRASP